MTRSERKTPGDYTFIEATQFEEWLRDIEFTQQESSSTYYRATRDDISTEVYMDAKEVTGVLIEFKLARSSPAQWKSWRAFINEACAKWQLSLFDPYTQERAGADRLFTILESTPAWKDFSSRCAWEAPPA
jgi:hypothetical protein